MTGDLKDIANYWRMVQSGGYLMPKVDANEISITICALDAAIKRITELTQRQDTTNCSAEPQTVLYRWKNPGKMNWFTSPFPPLDNRVEVEELIVRPKHG